MTKSNIYMLEQAANLLEEIDGRLYSSVPAGLSKAGIGGHVRHSLDFYESFLRGIETGRVDYDCRERNELIEQNRLAALEMIENTIAALRSLSKDCEQQVVMVKLEGEQLQDSPVWSNSSIRRELQFLLSHTVHHFALIAMLLRIQGFEPSPDFGVAPSTLKYWKAGK